MLLLLGFHFDASPRLRDKPVLVEYVGECMVLIINIKNNIKEPLYGYQNFN